MYGKNDILALIIFKKKIRKIITINKYFIFY